MIKSKSNYNLDPLINNIKGNKILDYRWRTRIDEAYIPQYFNSKIVFQSFNSFQQNNKTLGKKIRLYVKKCIRTNIINAIGGESYLYGMDKNSIFYTNSISIYNDGIYNKYLNTKIINYNIDTIILQPVNTIINLSKLNTNLLIQINNSSSNRLIIISCYHKDFWKKIKILENYKLINRKRFIEYKSKYFITVNILIRKSFVSLGGNCSVSYQLNKLKLRNKSYPFDWCQIKLSEIIKAFESNFFEFEIINKKKYSENHSSFIVNNKYGNFAHEVVKDGDYDLFKIKIIDRINKIKNIENPIFIRIETFNFKCLNVYVKYWKQILILFDNFYKNYQIILISKLNPKLKNIKWFSYNFDYDWKNNNIDWFNILINS